MRNIVKIGLATCLILGLSGCAEKEMKTNFISTSTFIDLNNDGSLSLGDGNDKIIIPDCPKRTLLDKVLLQKDTVNSFKKEGCVYNKNGKKVLEIFTEYKELPIDDSIPENMQ